jgi:hypothetical protein
MVLIYSPEIPVRLRYIAELLLSDLFNLQVHFTSSREEFIRHHGPAISYSPVRIGDTLHIEPDGLLSASGTADLFPQSANAGGMPVLFPSAGTGFPFDVFSAAFYMVSRYEEYLSGTKDKYGRFQASSGIASKYGFLDQPVVNQWAIFLTEALKKKFPTMELHPPRYRFTSTIDLDHAYAYRCRGLVRTLGGTGRSLSKFDFRGILERYMVLAGLEQDPFDCYDYIRSIHQSLGVKPHYFILHADYGHQDNNVRLTSKIFLNLLQRLASEGEIGLHPSLSSNKNAEKLDREAQRLSDATGTMVRKSRQHFLKVSMPKTYRQLIRIGMTDDYSMGFATATGFRAGIASPFRFFDLYRNEVTSLVIHPVSAMDVTFRDYLHIEPDDAIRRIKRIIYTVRSVNGEFISLWHNESLSGKGRWKGWRRVFEETSRCAAENIV